VTALAAGAGPAVEALPTGTSGSLDRDIASNDLRSATAMLDALQTAGVGFGIARLLPDINRVIDFSEAAVIAVTVAAATLALRLAMRATSPGASALWTNGVAAARAAALAVLLVGLETELASSLPMPTRAIWVWLLSWSIVAGINAYLLRAAAGRLLRANVVPAQFFSAR
jgi:hypothetical protein